MYAQVMNFSQVYSSSVCSIKLIQCIEEVHVLGKLNVRKSLSLSITFALSTNGGKVRQIPSNPK